MSSTISLVNPRDRAEKGALSKFRDEVRDLDLPEDVDDHFLLRWLRARDLNIVKAKQMLENYMNWCESWEGHKGLSTWTAPIGIIENIQFKFLGNDDDGRPVFWLPAGQYNPKPIIEAGDSEALIRYLHQCLHMTLAKIEEVKRTTGATQIIVIVDANGLSFRRASHIATIQLLFGFCKEFEAYYPEILGKIYILNAPAAFYWLFKLVKPLLSTVTVGKIDIYSYDANKWTGVLRQDIPMQVLPINYGGTAPSVL